LTNINNCDKIINNKGLMLPVTGHEFPKSIHVTTNSVSVEADLKLGGGGSRQKHYSHTVRLIMPTNRDCGIPQEKP